MRETRADGEASAPGVLGIVLAGGASSRMGREKAFALLHGRPLLAHVLQRFAPQVERVAINANGDAGRFAAFGCAVVPDGSDGASGPLSGVAAGLRFARAAGHALVATCPADAPFLPRDLVARLVAALGADEAACFAAGDEIEPLFALWRVDALPAVEAALADGRRAVRAALAEVGHVLVPARADDDFSNLNTPGDLAAAEAGGTGTPGA